jgi:serine/threonine-protein kinase
MSSDLQGLDLKQGDLLAGKFRVERVLGAGGMGVVVEATHVTLKDRVALKFLRAPRFADDTTIARFLREAQAAAKIKSPHVARVVDVGTLDNGSPYMVMEFLEGTDLGTVLEQSGVLPVETAVSYTLQTCEALAAAHAARVVHRDIKPSNLFLTQGPDKTPLIKVLDFGISKLLDANSLSGSITETQRAMGSPSYMAPEQMRSARRVDGRADIWSVGVVLYELLTGQLPFTAETVPELYALILDSSSVPSPMRAGREHLPAELERVVLKCLAKDPEQRFRDVAELAEALSPFGPELGPRSVLRTRRIIEAAGSSVGIPISSDTPESAAKPESRSRDRGSPGGTATSFSDTRPPQAKAKRRNLLVAAVGSGALLLVGAIVLMQTQPKPTAGSDARAGATTMALAHEEPREKSVAPAASSVAAAPSATSTASLTVSVQPPPPASMAAKPASSAPRAPRPKPTVEPTATPVEDDPMLHRK